MSKITKRKKKKNPYRSKELTTKKKEIEFIPDMWYLVLHPSMDFLFIEQFDHYGYYDYDQKEETAYFDTFDDKRGLMPLKGWRKDAQYIGPFYSHKAAFNYANSQFPGTELFDLRGYSGKRKMLGL